MNNVSRIARHNLDSDSTHWRLTEVEATFRSLKCELGLRPIWRTKPPRIRGHLFLAVLMYHPVRLLRIRFA